MASRCCCCEDAFGDTPSNPGDSTGERVVDARTLTEVGVIVICTASGKSSADLSALPKLLLLPGSPCLLFFTPRLGELTIDASCCGDSGGTPACGDAANGERGGTAIRLVAADDDDVHVLTAVELELEPDVVAPYSEFDAAARRVGESGGRDDILA